MAKNSILDYDTTPDNNTDMGGIGIQGTSAVNNFDNAFRTMMSQIADFTGGSTIASGTTTDLSSVKGQYVTVSGTSTIASFGTAKSGWMKYLRFTGSATLTYNATSMILPGASNITTQAGDFALFVSEGSGNWRCLDYSRAATLTRPTQRGSIYGLTLSNNASDTTNDIDFAAGECASTDAVPILMVHSAGTAQLDVAYGTGNGGRFDSAISDGTWHCFVISNGTTVSRGFSQALNPTSQPNYPAGYFAYRRVGAIIRAAGALRQFVQREDHFDYQVPSVERTSTAMQAATLLPLGVPFGIVTQPKLRILQGMNTAGNIQTMIASADKTEAIFANTTLAGEVDSVVISGGGIFTNTSSQIKFAVISPGGGTLIFNSLTTDGWIDTRGRS